MTTHDDNNGEVMVVNLSFRDVLKIIFAVIVMMTTTVGTAIVQTRKFDSEISAEQRRNDRQEERLTYHASEIQYLRQRLP